MLNDSRCIHDEGKKLLSENFFQIFENLPYLVYILNKDCDMVGCNKKVLSLLQINKIHEIVGTFYQHLVSVTGWSVKRVEALKREDITALLSEEPCLDVLENPIIDNQGNIFYYQSSRFPLSKKQKNIGLVVILEDITKRLKLEEQVKDMQSFLQKNNHKNQSNPDKISMPVNNIFPKILLIEDNSIAQKAVQSILLQLNCKVEIAANTEEVIKIFNPGEYDIIFMDIGLKDTSGYVMAKQIRQLEKDSKHHVPIIALTGYEAEVVKYDCNDYFMEGAITKPLTLEQAQEIIQHYILHIDIPIRGLKTVLHQTKLS